MHVGMWGLAVIFIVVAQTATILSGSVLLAVIVLVYWNVRRRARRNKKRF